MGITFVFGWHGMTFFLLWGLEKLLSLKTFGVLI
jgi:hypothetical protein